MTQIANVSTSAPGLREASGKVKIRATTSERASWKRAAKAEGARMRQQEEALNFRHHNEKKTTT